MPQKRQLTNPNLQRLLSPYPNAWPPFVLFCLMRTDASRRVPHINAWLSSLIFQTFRTSQMRFRIFQTRQQCHRWASRAQRRLVFQTSLISQTFPISLISRTRFHRDDQRRIICRINDPIVESRCWCYSLHLFVTSIVLTAICQIGLPTFE